MSAGFMFPLHLDSAYGNRVGLPYRPAASAFPGPLAHTSSSHSTKEVAVHTGTSLVSAHFSSSYCTKEQCPRRLEAHATSAPDGLLGHPSYRALWDFLAMPALAPAALP